jgi:hypothetical protein
MDNVRLRQKKVRTVTSVFHTSGWKYLKFKNTLTKELQQKPINKTYTKKDDIYSFKYKTW